MSSQRHNYIYFYLNEYSDSLIADLRDIFNLNILANYNTYYIVFVSGYAGRHNTTPPFTTKKMMSLFKDACENVSQENWLSVVNRTKKIIMDDFRRDIHVDIILDKEFIINVNDSSSSASNDSETE